ncbi:HIRAN domain-containing protein [Sporosarcina jeotgali]|uniref:HIRAN domain-containing protein n=1 Tax=Sporosarcina jeotgali TaxID=3020056 RepID=A0ABZ0KTY8_9BACL|nr:HIRAN domain-containing protein [Sporosarcina sp. B2O-1]WOV83902.1 HIRAN domain-containing protein [Sporosarcina sp. B2O-1]
MPELNVVGVIYDNPDGTNRQEVIRHVINSYKSKGKLKPWDNLTDEQIIADGAEGHEYENQVVKAAARLVKEPNNPHDPNAIKVILIDAERKKHHVGYIPKEKTAEVSRLMKTLNRIDVEFTGGQYKAIDIDDDENEYIDTYSENYGVILHTVDVVELTENNPFLKAGDGSPKAKMAGRLGCGLMVFILIMIVVIILS